MTVVSAIVAVPKGSLFREDGFRAAEFGSDDYVILDGEDQLRESQKRYDWYMGTIHVSRTLAVIKRLEKRFGKQFCYLQVYE
jgi:hypothetical protein